MSGHSKWANIKRQKAAVDAKKGAVYAKISREIIVSARLGGKDPAANFRLRQAIEKAKAAGVPNDNILRAIDKVGAGDSDDQLEELVYEGYGPGGVAIMVRCATDNKNRTAGDIRSCFSKHGGNLGETGCVNWMFKEQCEIIATKTKTLDDLILVALEVGVEDIKEDPELNGTEAITFFCKPSLVEAIKLALQQVGSKVISCESTLIPIASVEIKEKNLGKQLLKLLDALEDNEDVQQVYANFDMDQKWVQEFL